MDVLFLYSSITNKQICTLYHMCLCIPRMGKSKRAGRKLNMWKEEDMNAAVQEVKDGKLKLRVAARAYGLPLGSLQRRVTGKVISTGHCSGRKTVISKRDENALANHCLILSRRGFPMNRQQIRSVALQFCKQKGYPAQVKSAEDTGMLGHHWLDGFLQCHPNLATRRAESLSRARAVGLNAPIVDGWFNELGNFLKEKNVLNRGDKIWNFDETGIQMTFKTGTVIAEKGVKSVSSITPSEKGETVTVAACVSASGKYVPPMVLFKGKRMSAAMIQSLSSAPEGSVVALTESGYITSEMMVKWATHFCRFKPQVNPELPDVLLLDGHSTHVFNIEFLNIMSDNNVEVFALPPHTTHELQPLDKSFFKPLKNKWDELAQKAFREDHNSVSRVKFLKIFKECWSAVATVANAQGGFRGCGIVPFDRSAIPIESFSPSLSTEKPSAQPSATGSSAVKEMSALTISHATADLTVTSVAPVNLPPAVPSTSGLKSVDVHHTSNVDEIGIGTSQPTAPLAANHNLSPRNLDTPTRLLHQISPIPTTERTAKRRKRLLSCYRLTSKVHKEAVAARNDDSKKLPGKNKGGGIKRQKSQKTKKKGKSVNKQKRRKCACVECGGIYGDPSDNKIDEDWMSCPTCNDWMHESCFLSHDC